MIVLDANVLIYAFRSELPQHEPVRDWLIRRLTSQVVGLPLLAEMAFLRLMTKPLGALGAAGWPDAFGFLDAVLSYRRARRVSAGPRHGELFEELVRRYELAGDQLVDAWLAALALETDAVLASADADFGRFEGLRWVNPVNPHTGG